jgi:hypothetical protein
LFGNAIRIIRYLLISRRNLDIRQDLAAIHLQIPKKKARRDNRRAAGDLALPLRLRAHAIPHQATRRAVMMMSVMAVSGTRDHGGNMAASDRSVNDFTLAAIALHA